MSTTTYHKPKPAAVTPDKKSAPKFDVLRMKLGKKAPRIDSRTLVMARYTAALAPPPASCDLTSRITDLQMFDNDQLSDCTAAGYADSLQSLTSEAGDPFIPTLDEVITFYEGSTGYDPKKPSSDQGGIELDVLNYARQTGMGGRKLQAYATLGKHSSGFFSNSWQHDIARAVYYFGLAYIGLALPKNIQSQGNDWQFVSTHGDGAPGSLGGHCVIIVAYDSVGVTILTWAGFYKASWKWINTYMDEGYALFMNEILDPKTGKSPAGFNAAQLLADLDAVTA